MVIIRKCRDFKSIAYLSSTRTNELLSSSHLRWQHFSFLEHFNVVKLLIENGADVNLANDFGDLPLLMTNNLDTVKLLIKAGADVNAADNVKGTALLRAASSGNVYQNW